MTIGIHNFFFDWATTSSLRVIVFIILKAFFIFPGCDLGVKVSSKLALYMYKFMQLLQIVINCGRIRFSRCGMSKNQNRYSSISCKAVAQARHFSIRISRDSSVPPSLKSMIIAIASHPHNAHLCRLLRKWLVIG